MLRIATATQASPLQRQHYACWEGRTGVDVINHVIACSKSLNTSTLNRLSAWVPTSSGHMEDKTLMSISSV